MTIRIKRHRPAFFSGYPDEWAEADTTAELLAVEWIARVARFENFHRFSYSPARGMYGGKLMAEFDGGRIWYVVGHVEQGALDLPPWKPKP